MYRDLTEYCVEFRRKTLHLFYIVYLISAEKLPVLFVFDFWPKITFVTIYFHLVVLHAVLRKKTLFSCIASKY